MSPGEITEYYEKINKQYTRELSDALVVNRYAHHADKKDLKKFMKQLEKTYADKKSMDVFDVISAFTSFNNPRNAE